MHKMIWEMFVLVGDKKYNVWLDCFWVACVEQWGRTDILIQASSSRLGGQFTFWATPRLAEVRAREISQGPLLQSRLSESLQLKRGNFPSLSEGS